MSTKRIGLNADQWDKQHGIEHGPNGFRLCRLCKTETTYKRATLCSEACRTKWAILVSPSSARMHVYQRDKGICALCSLDTDLMTEMVNAPKHAYSRLYGRDRPKSRASRFVGWGGHPLLGGRVSAWDMDHIIPVVEGGGECDLDNLRTLCLWCHKQVTADLAARRARERNVANFNAKRKAASEKYGIKLELIEVLA